MYTSTVFVALIAMDSIQKTGHRTSKKMDVKFGAYAAYAARYQGKVSPNAPPVPYSSDVRRRKLVDTIAPCIIYSWSKNPPINHTYFAVTTANFKAMFDNIVANGLKLLKDTLNHSFQFQNRNSGKIF